MRAASRWFGNVSLVPGSSVIQKAVQHCLSPGKSAALKLGVLGLPGSESGTASPFKRPREGFRERSEGCEVHSHLILLHDLMPRTVPSSPIAPPALDAVGLKFLPGDTFGSAEGTDALVPHKRDAQTSFFIT